MIQRTQPGRSQRSRRTTAKTAPSSNGGGALSANPGVSPSKQTDRAKGHSLKREAHTRSLVQVAQELELSREKYVDLYDSSPVGYCTFDHVGCIREMNLTAAGLLGVERDHLIGRPFVGYVARDYTRKFLKHLWNCRHSQEPVITTEMKLRGKGGIPLHVELLSMPVRGPQRRMTQFRTVITDASKHVQTAMALSDTKQYKALFDQAAVGVAQTDASGRFVRVNQRYCEIVGRSVTELLAVRIQDLIHPDDLPSNLVRFKTLLAGGPSYQVEERYVRTDGSCFWVQNSVSAVRNEQKRPEFAVAITLDITERKRAEDRLGFSHAVARILAESATIEEATPNLLKAVCNYLDWDVGEFWAVDPGAGVLRNADFWHWPALALDKFEKVSRRSTFAKGEGFAGGIWSTGKAWSIPDFRVESKFLRAPYAEKAGLHAAFGFPIRFNGETLGVMDFFSRETRSSDPHPLQMFTALGSQLGQFMGRKRVEKALHQSEEQYRLLFERNPQPMWVHDQDTLAFLDVNPAAIAHYGYSREEFLGMTIKDIRPEEDAPELQRSAKHDRVWTVGEAGVWRHRKKDGSLIDVEITRSAITLNGRAAVLILAQDVTERKRAERRRAVEYAVVRILAETATIADAAPRLLQTIAQGFGWDVGELWDLDPETQKMRCRACWHRPGAELARFERETRQSSFSPGECLMGRISAQEKPLWFPHIEDEPNFSRAALATRANLKAAFGFPIRSDDAFLGAALFFHREIPEPDTELMETVSVLSSQIAQFIQRRLAEKALRESEEWFRALTEHATDLIAIVDAAGLIRYASRSLERILGYSPEEMLGKNGLDFVYPQDAARLRELLVKGVWTTGATRMAEHRVRHKDGSWRYLESFGRNLLSHPAINGIVINSRDITEKKQSEEKLLRFNEQLEERVAKRTTELKRTNEKLRAEIERRRGLEREVLEVSDREQRRIGQDLHDELAPHLAGVAFLASTLQSRLEEKSLQESADAKRIADLLGDAVQQTRKLAWVVSPITLEADGLNKALERLASSIGNIYNIRCQFVCRQPVLIQQNVLATVNLYRIAQETVHKAIKHGKASRVEGSLSCAEDDR